MLRLSDLVQLHAKIESRHLVIPNPTGPRLHLSFSIWMSLSDANKFAENFLSFCWMLQKLFLFDVNPSMFQAAVSAWRYCSICSWLTGLTFCVWWLAVSSRPVPWRLPLYCLEVLCYWFPARTPCSTCQSTSRTVGCRRERVVNVWCLADG